MKKRTLVLKEDTHQYFDEEGNEYISVTKLIALFYVPFNKDYWAERKAKERGITKEQVLQEWTISNQESSLHGKHKHQIIDDFTKGISSELEEVEQLKPILELINKLGLEGKGMYSEHLIYHPEFFVAGTIDLLAFLQGKKVLVYDWKTNKDELRFSSGYYKKENGIKTNTWVEKEEYFFKPIDHLPYCKGYIYNLQLSIYAYLLECWGFIIQGLRLYHFRKDTEFCETYNIKYLREEAKALLEYYHEHKSKLIIN